MYCICIDVQGGVDGMQGVPIMYRELEKVKLSGSVEPTLYDFAVLDVVWSGVAQGSDAVQVFLATDGLGALLDILNKGALPMQPVLLTIISGTLPIIQHDVPRYCPGCTGTSPMTM